MNIEAGSTRNYTENFKRQNTDSRVDEEIYSRFQETKHRFMSWWRDLNTHTNLEKENQQIMGKNHMKDGSSQKITS